jgi:hypothetical protein
MVDLFKREDKAYKVGSDVAPYLKRYWNDLTTVFSPTKTKCSFLETAVRIMYLFLVVRDYKVISLQEPIIVAKMFGDKNYRSSIQRLLALIIFSENFDAKTNTFGLTFDTAEDFHSWVIEEKEERKGVPRVSRRTLQNQGLVFDFKFVPFIASNVPAGVCDRKIYFSQHSFDLPIMELPVDTKPVQPTLFEKDISDNVVTVSKEKLKEVFATAVDEYKYRLVSLEKEINSLKSEEFEDRLEIMEKEINSLKSENVILISKVSAYTEKVEAYSEKTNNLTKLVKKMLSDNDSYKSELETIMKPVFRRDVASMTKTELKF